MGQSTGFRREAQVNVLRALTLVGALVITSEAVVLSNPSRDAEYLQAQESFYRQMELPELPKEADKIACDVLRRYRENVSQLKWAGSDDMLLIDELGADEKRRKVCQVGEEWRMRLAQPKLQRVGIERFD